MGVSLDVIYGKIWYLIYSLYFVIYTLFAYWNIWKSYLKSVGTIKFQLKFILISTIIAGILGTIFDLILPYYNYWKLNWFGPYFTKIHPISLWLAAGYLERESLKTDRFSNIL